MSLRMMMILSVLLMNPLEFCIASNNNSQGEVTEEQSSEVRKRKAPQQMPSETDENKESKTPPYIIYKGEEDLRVLCCCTVARLKKWELIELKRDYTKKSKWVLHRDFIEEIINWSLFPLLWPCHKIVGFFYPKSSWKLL